MDRASYLRLAEAFVVSLVIGLFVWSSAVYIESASVSRIRARDGVRASMVRQLTDIQQRLGVLEQQRRTAGAALCRPHGK